MKQFIQACCPLRFAISCGAAAIWSILSATAQAPAPKTFRLTPDSEKFRRDDAALFGEGFDHRQGSYFYAKKTLGFNELIDVEQKVPEFEEKFETGSVGGLGWIRIIHKDHKQSDGQSAESFRQDIEGTARPGRYPNSRMVRDEPDAKVVVYSEAGGKFGGGKALYLYRDHAIKMDLSGYGKDGGKIDLDAVAAWFEKSLPLAWRVADTKIARQKPKVELQVEVLEITVEKWVEEGAHVEVIRAGDISDGFQAKVGMMLQEADRIFTGIGTEVKIKFSGGDIATIGELTDMKIAAFRSKGDAIQTRLWVRAGEVTAQVDKSDIIESDFQIRTPTATAGVRGTVFSSKFDTETQGNRIAVTEGIVRVTPENPSLAPRDLKAGESVTVYSDRIEPADAGAAVAGAELRGLSAPTKSARAGTQSNIAVRLNTGTDKASAGVRNLNFELLYDPKVLEVAGEVQRGSVLGFGVSAAPGKSSPRFEANVQSPGRIRIGFASAEGVAGSGDVASIPFKVIGQPGAETALTLKVVKCDEADGKPLALGATDGRITVPSPQRPATVPPSTPFVQLDGEGRLGKNADGTLKGDADGDFRLTAKDAEKALKISVGKLPDDANLDVDASRVVDSSDAAIILQKASELIGAGVR